MKEKALIQRAVPWDTAYALQGIKHGSIFDDAQTCENCGKMISHVAHIKGANGKHFYVGTDCAETIVKATTDSLQGLVDVNEIERFARFNKVYLLALRKDSATYFLKSGKAFTHTWKGAKDSRYPKEFRLEYEGFMDMDSLSSQINVVDPDDSGRAMKALLVYADQHVRVSCLGNIKFQEAMHKLPPPFSPKAKPRPYAVAYRLAKA